MQTLDNKENQYNILCKSLISMREEYKIMPSRFLKKCIGLAEKKIKAIDNEIGKYKNPNGNYNA